MLNSILNHIPFSSERIALIDGVQQLSYQQLQKAVSETADYLQNLGAQRVATMLDNSIDWVIFDLACQMVELCFVPLPHFFTPGQVQHAISETSIDTLFIHENSPLKLNYRELSCPFEKIRCLKKNHAKITAIPEGTAKITFTSGSTGNPKGVCLSLLNQLIVAQSLVETINIAQPRHLCLLPLSTLLENIAGIYAPLISGGTVVLPDSSNRGLCGSSMVNTQTLLNTITLHQPTTLILVPELLLLLISAAEKGWIIPSSIEFIAVGGSKVSISLLQRALQLNLPVYQGYGLSECASVVSLCSLVNNKLGSVGKLLPHIRCTTQNGELIVRGNNFLGYVSDQASWHPKNIKTGDLGHFDAEGFCSITGRKKNLIISSFGRNISPEWIESECLKNGLLNQCVVFGDAQPWSVALLSPSNSQVSDKVINDWMKEVSQFLPDYAQVKNWYRISNRLSSKNGLLTVNGRPKRLAIQQFYQKDLQKLFTTTHHTFQ